MYKFGDYIAFLSLLGEVCLANYLFSLLFASIVSSNSQNWLQISANLRTVELSNKKLGLGWTGTNCQHLYCQIVSLIATTLWKLSIHILVRLCIIAESWLSVTRDAAIALCASSLQYLAAPQDFYSPVSIFWKRSWWPRIRSCGTAVFQEQG